MMTLSFIIVAAAIVFIAGAIGCIIGEITLKFIKYILKK